MLCYVFYGYSIWIRILIYYRRVLNVNKEIELFLGLLMWWMMKVGVDIFICSFIREFFIFFVLNLVEV